jgi:hypothetical protein
MTTTIPQAPDSGPAGTPRDLHAICEDTRRGQCGLCAAMPSEPCAYSGTGPDGYHVARFAWAEAHHLISLNDMAAVLDDLGRFMNSTVVYDKGRSTVSDTEHDVTAALGPFRTGSDAMLAVRPEDGSFTGREELFDLLKKTLHATGVRLCGWDWRTVRWLADQDVQTVAAIAGWVTRSLGLADPGDYGREPYCAECGSWIGMFFGLEDWQHFRGDPAPGGQRQLFDPGHAAVPAWRELPGRSVSPADGVTIGQALADAERYRRDSAEAWCADCDAHPAGACDRHLDDLDRAGAYAELARQLQQEEEEEEDR